MLETLLLKCTRWRGEYNPGWAWTNSLFLSPKSKGLSDLIIWRPPLSYLSKEIEWLWQQRSFCFYNVSSPMESETRSESVEENTAEVSCSRSPYLPSRVFYSSFLIPSCLELSRLLIDSSFPNGIPSVYLKICSSAAWAFKQNPSPWTHISIFSGIVPNPQCLGKISLNKFQLESWMWVWIFFLTRKFVSSLTNSWSFSRSL